MNNKAVLQVCSGSIVMNIHCDYQIRSYWMPLLRKVLPEEHRRPIILVGNKSDMLEVSSMEVRSFSDVASLAGTSRV